METVTDFLCLGDRISSGGGCEADVRSRTRLGWIKFRDCQDLLCGKVCSLKIKGSVCKICVRSAMHYGSETWCLDLNEIVISQRTIEAMVKCMCGGKLIDKKSTKESMLIMNLNEMTDELAKDNNVRCNRNVLRTDRNKLMRRAFDLNVNVTRKRGRPKKTCQ